MLEELYRGALRDSAQRKLTTPESALRELIKERPPARDALAALAPRATVHVIAEIKRESPSKGPLAEIPDPVELASSYARGGASVISVLTEEQRFGGSLHDLDAVSRSVQIPVLRKDFLAEEYQILEARAYGADLVLLIMAGLTDERVVELQALARSLGMAALVEAHSADEVERAIACGATIIGVNARNLSTFELDPTLFAKLRPLIPDGVVAVAESAVASSQDVSRYRVAGADAVLVGEALVTEGDPESRVREFSQV